ncbi:hypothetical protein TNCV_1039881 [Trichonephila clavipes]|nr:hypothetical protein TNCV_1039881 [Trichonephila clavipes]
MHVKNLRPTVKYGRGNQIVWGCMNRFSGTERLLHSQRKWRKRLRKINEAKRGRLATDLVILKHGQVMKMTSELESLSPDFHSIPTGGRFSLDIFNVHRIPLHGGS